MLKGPDLSKWQGIIDFEKLKSAVDFVILRSSYGITSVDSKFYEYAENCKRVGIPVLGVYHFCYAKDVNQAEKEALNCMSVVEKVGLGKDTILFYDLEYDSVEKAKKNYGVTIDKNKCNEFTTAFCHKVTTAGYRAGIYFNCDYYRNMYSENVLNQYIKWLADYRSEPRYQCDLHQCSSTGTLPGISGSVDINYLRNESLLVKGGSYGMTQTEFAEEVQKQVDNYRAQLRDQDASDWSKEARDFCIENKIFRGDGDGNYRWKDLLTREEAAQIIYNLFKKK